MADTKVSIDTQVAAAGLRPKAQYQVYLAESDSPPYGRLVPLAVLHTNQDGAGIVQTLGPLKSLTIEKPAAPASARRFLIITEDKDSSRVVLKQSGVSNSP